MPRACAVVFVAVAVAAASLLGMPARAAGGQQPVAAGVPDFEGGWVRIDPAGSGSFGGLAARFPRAALTAQGAAMKVERDPDDVDPDLSRPRAPGDAYIVSQGRCGGPGGGGIEPNSAALFIVQTRDEVLLVREGPGARRIFMDGRSHPDLAVWTPTALGHSVGRYEGEALVVETIGLTPGNVTAGGRRTPRTRLTERYRLSRDGARLTITYTWSDPELYQRPHTYELQLDRLPRDSYAFENWCDSGDPRQRQSIVPPKQIGQ